MTTRCSTWFFVLSIEVRGERRVTVGVAGPRRRAGQRVRRDRAPVDGDQQLRRRSEEPVDGEAVAQPERRLEAVEDAVAVERAASP